jgi:Cft2 family RNA processing exonuclease
MAVMLADATRVMARRARDEMELPLYDEDLVARTLQRLRPVPAPGTFTVPELPAVIVHTAPAGHIAGACWFRATSPWSASGRSAAP